jgi:NAD(P)-dependent dehydrogenase (short-subunit alcohol dehydrogenase family)
MMAEDDRMTDDGLRLAGAGVVVTGAGGGIGAGLARAFAAEGARVVVNDLDADACRAVAGQIGAHPAPGDAGSVEGVRALVAAARDHLGEIDLYCANAGVAPPGGVVRPGKADERDWALAFEVNVLAHIRAAEQLLPAWLKRGRGHLLVTASAAGLLMMPGSAPYSVTKHAAVAFAEWLRATYQHRGIVVQALCPKGVRTAMLSRGGPAAEAVVGVDAIEVDDVVAATLAALGTGQFLVLPHPDVAQLVEAKAGDPDGWLAGMNRLQQELEAGRGAPPASRP